MPQHEKDPDLAQRVAHLSPEREEYRVDVSATRPRCVVVPTTQGDADRRADREAQRTVGVALVDGDLGEAVGVARF